MFANDMALVAESAEKATVLCIRFRNFMREKEVQSELEKKKFFVLRWKRVALRDYTEVVCSIMY